MAQATASILDSTETEVTNAVSNPLMRAPLAQLRLLAGQDYGRTIPLCDIDWSYPKLGIREANL